MKYKEMKDKYDYMQNFNMGDKREIAKTVAVFRALPKDFSYLLVLQFYLNFPRFNKMKGMGQIVTWSVRDETLHCNSMIKIFKRFCDENPGLLDDSLKKEI